MESKQIQKSGDGSQQVQMNNTTIIMGIDEKRVREVCSEMAVETIKQCTQEASDTAIARIDKFTTDLIPRIERIEKNFKCFSEPSFQFELRNAQKVAACTDRNDDYELLSELLVHRIEKGEERRIKASISKAIEIVDQIDDDALCALTILHAINSWTPKTGNITTGMRLMNDLFSSICYRDLPEGLEWANHLDMLNAARVSSIGTFKKFEDFYSDVLDGYSAAGIKKESEEYQKSIEILNEANLPVTLLVEHELNKEYVRLNVRNNRGIEDILLPFIVLPETFELRNPNQGEIDALNKVWGLYSTDVKAKNSTKQAFIEKWDSFDALKTVRLWWNALPHSITITPIGTVLAHANAQRHNPNVPNLKK